MSRSFKKTPMIKLDNSSFGKKQANKRVRKFDIANGSSYKKLYESYDICDYKCNFYRTHGMTYDRLGQRPMTIEEINEYWRK
jgi:hypothetical protein